MNPTIPLRPFLFRAVYDWALENGLTPHIVVDATQPDVQVPASFVRDGRITLNIHPAAVATFHFDHDGVSFSARFNAAAFNVSVPMRAVTAVFAKENGRGMFFPDEPVEAPTPPEPPRAAKPTAAKGRTMPALRRVK